MTPRLLILLGIVTIALLPLVPVPAEPGGGIQRSPSPQAPLSRTKLSEVQGDLRNAVKFLGKTRADMAAALKKQQARGASAQARVVAALKLAQEPGTPSAQKMDAIRKSLESALKELEAQDRMDNFEIQRLMSSFNQAEALASSVQKKLDDTISAQQQKIGREGANDDACCG
jgi:hypothetical protein